MRHYLITGGAGFIGNNLIGQLFKSEKRVFVSCVVNFDPFYPEQTLRWIFPVYSKLIG
jgi:UDP-glucuronate 4-epimerase